MKQHKYSGIVRRCVTSSLAGQPSLHTQNARLYKHTYEYWKGCDVELCLHIRMCAREAFEVAPPTPPVVKYIQNFCLVYNYGTTYYAITHEEFSNTYVWDGRDYEALLLPFQSNYFLRSEINIVLTCKPFSSGLEFKGLWI